MNKHDTIIYAIVGIIICVQLFFFLKNFKKIIAYKNIIADNDNLSVIELSIDENQITTLDPEHLIKNKSFYENIEKQDSEFYNVGSEFIEPPNDNEDTFVAPEELYVEHNEDDRDLNLFS